MKLPNSVIGRRSRSGVLSLAALVLCALGAQARADRSEPIHSRLESRSMQVRFDDLDLSQADGVRIAQQRLRDAARRLCASAAAPEDSWRQPDHFSCVDKAMKSALPRLETLVRNTPLPGQIARSSLNSQ